MSWSVTHLRRIKKEASVQLQYPYHHKRKSSTGEQVSMEDNHQDHVRKGLHYGLELFKISYIHEF